MKVLFHLLSPKRSNKRSSKSVIPNNRLLLMIILALLPATFFAQQSTTNDSTKVNQLDEVLISSIRITSKTPISFSNLDKKDIAPRNLGQDIPVLMNYMPSVVTTSDAGNGFGYTGIRVRGSDATRVNVTINGIPYNDSESSGTYFVDMPDFASSLQSIQLQRGVGTSTNGAGAFGASLNMLTDNYSKKSNAEISNSYGSFNSHKHTVKFSTGLMNDHFELAGRVSTLKSDGYVDRASSDLKSYFFQATYVGKTTLIKALAFGGKERTYQAWNGIDADMLATNPSFNYSGMYTDQFGNTQFYKNEVDDYQQDHFQLHWNEKVSTFWNTNVAVHYTKGKGFYENYHQGASFTDYGLTPVGSLTTTDLITRKWLDNNFYGTTFSANYKKNKVDFIFGGALNKYEGSHYDEVTWARYASTSQPGDNYYTAFGNKIDFNTYSKVNYQLTTKISLYGDLQYRYINYKANGIMAGDANVNFNFFNPKAGITYDFNKKSSIYFSYAKANREPNRTDFENGLPKSEKMDDYEFGWRLKTTAIKLNTNFYLMNYKDQLVKTGAVNDVGSELRANVDKSYRAGLEIDAMIRFSSKLYFSPNLTISRNKIKNYAVDTGSGLVNYGTTNISFSPNVIAGSKFTYLPISNLQVSLLNKYVGEQYAGNFDTEETKLKSYATIDFNASYEIKPKSVFQAIVFSALVNNLSNHHYISNAYLYGNNYMSYFPQAGTNFLVGMTLKF